MGIKYKILVWGSAIVITAVQYYLAAIFVIYALK
jgi:hypothetical protein